MFLQRPWAAKSNLTHYFQQEIFQLLCWCITWCQFWLELLIFFTEPGWRTFMSLKEKRETRMNVHFWDDFRIKMTQINARLVQLLTRTAELHPSGSPWSCPRSFCRSHPLSTASAPLPYEGHTCLQADIRVGEAASHMTNIYWSVSTTTSTTIVWNLIIDQL